MSIPTCSSRQDVFAEFEPVGEFLHGQRGQHVAQRVMDVGTQLPVRLPVQHTKQNPLQTGLCDVQIWANDKDRTVMVTVPLKRS